MTASRGAAAHSTPGSVLDVTRDGACVLITCERATMTIRFWVPSIAEVSLTPTGFSDAGVSYARDPELSPAFLEIEMESAGGFLTISSEELVVRVRERDTNVSFLDSDGRIFVESPAAYSWSTGADGRISESVFQSRLRPDERLLGLGDKPSAIDRRGRTYEDWNTDAFGFKRNDDPLYKSIPFVLGIVPDASGALSYGLLFDHPGRGRWDVGATGPDLLTFTAERPPSFWSALRFVVFAGKNPVDVVQQLAAFSGRMPMLPKWALGYHQCRYSYRDEEEVRSIARELRERAIPCDVIYFDIHYMDGYRVFTWDPLAFPNPAKLLSDLRTQGFRTVAIIDPGVKVDKDYPVYQGGIDDDVFVRERNGDRYVGEVWPGECHFPDFMRANARKWWGDQHQGLVTDGIDGIWDDMNEPAVFPPNRKEHESATMPDDVVHDCDGHEAEHAEVHNLYGMQMLKATYEGLSRLQPDRRPFTITRAGATGAQRYGTTWTGDNSATWDHLRIVAEQLLSLNVCSFPFAGSDIGGFSNVPTAELMVRWNQLGVLSPLFRNHSAVDTPPQEPWRFGPEAEKHCRSAIELRYRLLPYWYTVLRDAAQHGLPMLRALALMHPDDARIAARPPSGFYLGESLLAYPVLKNRQRRARHYLPDVPDGWFDFHTGAHYPAGKLVTVDTPLDRLPLYVRAGSILPIAPVRQHTGEPVNHLTLQVYLGDTITGHLYEDRGDGWEFTEGEFAHYDFTARRMERGFAIKTSKEGSSTPEWKSWRYELHGVSGRVAAIRTGENQSVPFTTQDGIVSFETSVGSGFDLELIP
ncbi:glycoside hydrolase family 31 protein [soil metagenome]